jgi:hypothetical protein
MYCKRLSVRWELLHGDLRILPRLISQIILTHYGFLKSQLIDQIKGFLYINFCSDGLHYAHKDFMGINFDQIKGFLYINFCSDGLQYAHRIL